MLYWIPQNTAAMKVAFFFFVHHNEPLLFTFSLFHSLYNHSKPTLLALPSIKQSNTRCSADSSTEYNAKDRKELISASVVKQRKESRFSWYDLGLQMAIVSGPVLLYVSLAIPPWAAVGNLNVGRICTKHVCLPLSWRREQLDPLELPHSSGSAIFLAVRA